MTVGYLRTTIHTTDTNRILPHVTSVILTSHTHNHIYLDERLTFTRIHIPLTQTGSYRNDFHSFDFATAAWSPVPSCGKARTYIYIGGNDEGALGIVLHGRTWKMHAWRAQPINPQPTPDQNNSCPNPATAPPAASRATPSSASAGTTAPATSTT